MYVIQFQHVRTSPNMSTVCCRHGISPSLLLAKFRCSYQTAFEWLEPFQGRKPLPWHLPSWKCPSQICPGQSRASTEHLFSRSIWMGIWKKADVDESRYCLQPSKSQTFQTRKITVRLRQQAKTSMVRSDCGFDSSGAISCWPWCKRQSRFSKDSWLRSQ